MTGPWSEGERSDRRGHLGRNLTATVHGTADEASALAELQDDNPLGLLRQVDGVVTRDGG